MNKGPKICIGPPSSIPVDRWQRNNCNCNIHESLKLGYVQCRHSTTVSCRILPKDFRPNYMNNAHFFELFHSYKQIIAIFIFSFSLASIPHGAMSASERGDEPNLVQHYSCETIYPTFSDSSGTTWLQHLQVCPTNLRLSLSTSGGNEFVIDLTKNTRLISEKYFKLNGKAKYDQLGNKINLETGISPNQDDFYKNHQYISLHNFKHNDDHCHYLGNLNGETQSFAAISVMESRLLSGFFHDGDYSYHLLSDSDKRTTVMVKTKTGTAFPSNQQLEKCSNNDTHLSRIHRSRRAATASPSLAQNSVLRRKKKASQDNKVLHGPFQQNSSSLFVELLIVFDHSQFKGYRGNTTLITERTMQIVNIMNAFYRQLNIFISLVGVVLWTVEDEIKLTEDGDSTLTNFLKYRYEKLLPRYHHDNAQLITSTSFNGSVVGKALKGPICTHDHSGGVNTDHSHSTTIVAVTLAHELGHNLGMEHDEDDKCSCPDEKCIMSSSSSLVHPKHWSSCSVEYLEESRKHGLLDCLMNEPEQVIGPVCGNGFVEEGEDCDMGDIIPSYGLTKSKNKNNGNRIGTRSNTNSHYLSWLSNPCCDRTTCKFAANASCAQGPCCDVKKCSVFNSSETRVCRAKKSECDFEEVCDGISEYCPPDVHYHDGVECGPSVSLEEIKSPAVFGSTNHNRSRSYCYQGQCASHETQCQLLWGSSGTTSRDICYDQNVHGNTSGNCGYSRKEKIYQVCEPEDTLCGMLHCVHTQPSSSDTSRKTGKLGYGFESASILTVSFFIMANHERIYCHGAIIDAGPYMRDPGLVPNGAACGEDKMCLNQKCVPVADIVYKNWCPSDCNGNGICDNMGICHCHDGTIGTSCYQFFGSNFHFSLILYMIMFFGPMVALIVLTVNHYKKQLKIWWFLHNRKIALRNISKQAGHHHQQSAESRRAMAYQAKHNQVTISDPIPLSQNISPHKSTSTQQGNNVDPWAETSTTEAPTPTATLISALTTPTKTSSTAVASAFGPSRTPGYRLEPLPRKPLEPLPPPVPPHQNQPSRGSGVQHAETEANSLRPVRAAPPPPPPPPHANRGRAT